MFNSWVTFVVIFVFARLIFLQTFKHTTRETKSIGSLTIVVQIISALSILVLTPFFAWTWPSGWLTWFLMAIGLGLYAINDRLDATTRKELDITTDTMLHQSYRILFLITGIIFLGRSFVWLRLLGGFIIVFACMFLLFERGRFTFNRYVIIKLISVLFFTAALTLDMYNSPEFNLPFFVFISFGAPAVYLMIARQSTFRGLVTEIRRKDWWVIIICGIAQGLAAFAFLRALQFRDYFVEVASITAIHIVLNVFFAYIFLGERNGLVRKIISSAIIVGAIVMIAVL